jgi:hypothetical protein
MRKLVLFVLLVLVGTGFLSGKEGMWIPLLLEKYNMAEMRQLGFQLSAEDVYDPAGDSMKDAVVVFGGGCTGGMISAEGLLITNHHCGYRQIQSHSSIENDYLTDGFWAMNRQEELPNPGLTVRFLEYMEDVTAGIMEGTENLQGEEKDKKIRENTIRTERQASERGKYFSQVKPLFYGNQYYLYVYKIYHDVRLVGAPPSAIGKFGGDTDNWMWPRHTGDFALFRVYAGPDNEPAEYSTDNVPYRPKKFFPVSVKGVQPEDFTMVFGNPGSTMQYIPSHEVDIIMTQRNPDRIAIRDRKLDIMNTDMADNPLVRIQYAAKHASVSNAWKKWQGEITGLQRLDAAGKKKVFEEDFKNWAIANGTWENTYQPVFENFDSIYVVYRDYIKASDYYAEIVLRGIELFELASRFSNIIYNIENNQEKLVEGHLKSAAGQLPAFFRDYNQPTDEKLFETLLPMLVHDLKPAFVPEHLNMIMAKHTQGTLLKNIYRKSVLNNHKHLAQLIEKGDRQALLQLKKDPLMELYEALFLHFDKMIKPVVDLTTAEINRNMKIYMAGIMQMKEGQPLYPDANLTLRVAYGKVEGYQPNDGVVYKHYTTLDGIMEKDNPDIYDYNVPQRLRDLYSISDYGPYAMEGGKLPVAFTASNHTTGGNSGSPVVNARGELIGVNFDRCWEGTMSDIMYDPEMSRNIMVDMRYVLFIVDRFAGAGYLLDEMELTGVQHVVPELQ